MPGLGTRDEALTSPAANERDPWCREYQGHFIMKPMRRAPVYFETAFAYFVAMIKRPFGVLCGRHWNPVGQESFLQLQQQPAIIFSEKSTPSLAGMFFSQRHFSFPVPQLWGRGGGGGAGEGRSRRQGMGVTEE